MAVVGPTVVRNQDDLLQLMGLHQEIELLTRGLVVSRVAVVRRQPGRPAGDRPAVVARDKQVLVAELVEGLAPAAVAAIEGQGADPLRVPTFGAGEHRQGQLRAQLEGAPTDRGSGSGCGHGDGSSPLTIISPAAGWHWRGRIVEHFPRPTATVLWNDDTPSQTVQHMVTPAASLSKLIQHAQSEHSTPASDRQLLETWPPDRRPSTSATAGSRAWSIRC